MKLVKVRTAQTGRPTPVGVMGVSPITYEYARIDRCGSGVRSQTRGRIPRRLDVNIGQVAVWKCSQTWRSLVHLSTNKIAYYEAALRGITKTDLVESETQPNTRLPDERLELQCGQL